jgi:hypothetical protein
VILQSCSVQSSYNSKIAFVLRSFKQYGTYCCFYCLALFSCILKIYSLYLSSFDTVSWNIQTPPPCRFGHACMYVYSTPNYFSPLELRSQTIALFRIIPLYVLNLKASHCCESHCSSRRHQLSDGSTQASILFPMELSLSASKNLQLICKNGCLDFAHRLSQRFGSWIFFRLKIKRKNINPTCWSPGWARVYVLPFNLKTEEDPASETLWFYWNTDDGQSPENRFYRL